MSEVMAGPDTDARIAREVFAWEVAEVRYGAYMLAQPEAEFGWLALPRYSTRIEDAWSVWEWCLEHDEALVLRKADQYDRIANGQAGFIACRVDWYQEDWDDLTFGETVPLAICRAALKLREETS